MNRHTLVLLFLLALPSGIALADPVVPPDEVVRQFMQALVDGDEQRAVGLTSPSNARLVEDVTDDIRMNCIAIPSFYVHRTRIEGERAHLDVTATILRTPRSGKGRATQEVERRELRLKSEAGGWRIDSMTRPEDLLASQIRDNPGKARELIAQHPDLVGPVLVRAMVGAARSLDPRDYGSVLREMVDVALEVAQAIDDRSGQADAIAGQLMEENVPGADPRALLPRAELAFQIALEEENPELIARSGNILATLYQNEDGSSRDAERVFHRILQYRESLPQSIAGTILTNLAQLLMIRQDYTAAYQFFTEAPAMTPDNVAFSEMNLGRLFELQNDPQAALEHFRRSAQVVTAKPFEIMAHLGMARAHRALGHPAEAWQEAERAAEITSGTPFKGLMAQCFIIRTELQIDRGEKAGAEETLQKALAHARAVRSGPIEINVLLSLGSLYLDGGRFADALRMAQDAEAIWRRFEFAGPERYDALMLAARAEQALGHEEQAIARFSEAIDAIESVRGAVAGSERQQMLFFEPYHAAYIEMVNLLLARGRVEEALIYAERGKGRVLLDTIGQQQKDADALMTPEERSRRVALLEKLSSANRRIVILKAAANADPQAVSDARSTQRESQQDLDCFDSDLDAREPRLRVARGEAATIQPSMLGELVLQPDFAILEYVVHDRWTTLFVIERRGGKTVITPHRIDMTREALDARVQAYVDELAERRVGFRESARGLYRVLLAPAASQIAGKRILCIVPDGSLWHVPFESLAGPDEKFLIEKSACFYVPSISVYREIMLHRRADGAPAEHRLAAFGNPAIESARQRVASVHRAADLGPLPEAEAEVKTIARIWGPETAVYVGRDAREDVAKREMTASRIVHFAAHGMFDDANPMFSQIVLAPGTGSSDDGVLQAWELMRLRLSANLVVLSACETARGRVGAGEGLIGLSWALFAGGCPSTVATRWKIASGSAARLMVAFHGRLVRANAGSPFMKAAALRAAQLSMLRDPATAHPFHWAGFVLVGSGS
jgi:CHAT domain-containing protein